MITMIRCQNCKVWFNEAYADREENIDGKGSWKIQRPIIICPFCRHGNYLDTIRSWDVNILPLNEVRNNGHHDPKQ